MSKKKIISGKYFREHPFCIKSETLVEIIDHGNLGLNGKRVYFDGYDTFGKRKATDYFDLYPVFKEVAKDGGMNPSKSYYIDAFGFTSGLYDLRIVKEPEY